MHCYTCFYSAVPDLVLGTEVAADPEAGAEAVLVRGPDPVLVPTPAPGPSLPEETEREAAVDHVPGMAPSKGALAHAASLQLGIAMNVPIPAASPGAHLLEIAVLLQTKRGVHQIRRCIPAVPPLLREVAMKTNS